VARSGGPHVAAAQVTYPSNRRRDFSTGTAQHNLCRLTASSVCAATLAMARKLEIETDGSRIKRARQAAVSRLAAYTGRMRDALAVMMILGLQCAYKILYNTGDERNRPRPWSS